jgi:hypothetical protein
VYHFEAGDEQLRHKFSMHGKEINKLRLVVNGGKRILVTING